MTAIPAEVDERTEISLDDLPDVDKAVPCEWNDIPGECPQPAEYHVVTRAIFCTCGQVTALLCADHEKLVRKAAAQNELGCRPHSAPVRWVRSVPL